MNEFDIAMLATGVIGMMVFGRWKALQWYPYAGCRACNGTGRRHIERWKAVLTLTSTKAFRDCDACQGKPKRSRRMIGQPR